jgi:hypothetical protein
VWLIQIALIIVATITLLLAGTIVGLVLFVPTILLAVAEYTTPAVVTGIIAGLILLPLVIVAAAALSTFNHAYWTLTYLRISGRDLPIAVFSIVDPLLRASASWVNQLRNGVRSGIVQPPT